MIITITCIVNSSALYSHGEAGVTAAKGVDPMISSRAVETLVCQSSHGPRTKIRTRFKNGKKLRVVRKLDEEQVKWIMRQKHRDEMSDAAIGESAGVSARWVRKLWSRYRFVPVEDIAYPPRMGRPPGGLPGRREHPAAISCRRQDRRMAVRLEVIVGEEIGIHIAHRVTHGILKDGELAERQPRKARRRKWVRYERRYSNSLWHADCKQLPDGRWFVSHMDDASGLTTGFGVFAEATAANAIAVLEEAVQKYGRPAGVLTDRGSQFYANEREGAGRGEGDYERKLVEPDIRHSMARIRHPQTNGKPERFHSEIGRHLKSFEDESASNTVRDSKPGDRAGSPFHTAGTTDPMTRLVDWHNNLPHMSLKDGRETPAEAYVRKQAPKDITTEEMESDVHAKA
ncbi:MAG: DDE-type integrase/transposase/recombinase [Thaumarchaeota archaeon]|nr:DDE-type integrase/transposase/recombinase [Nitrososphaerota archaeon]MDE0090069.1 DDE-type integrase/transposase/recombinase [Nitrososphaerota archaeon]